MLCMNSMIGYSQLQFTTYHDKEGKETKSRENAYYVKTLTIKDDSSVDVREEYSSTNSIKLIGTFKDFKNKFYIGPKLEAYENGKIKLKQLYSHDGVLIDTAYYYHKNGKLKLAFSYPYKVNNEKTTVTDTLILVYSDSTGKRLLSDGNGLAEIDINSDVERGQYKNHKRIGIWTGEFLGGKYTFSENYINGKLESGKSIDSIGHEYTYTEKNFMTPPDYPGGIHVLRNFIGQNYKYPKEGILNRVKGTVRISFVIDRDGKMTEIKVVEDLGFGTGEAAIQVLKRAKKWSPGIMRGVPVRVAYALPIRLDLTR